MAQSRHLFCAAECPLPGVKRTSLWTHNILGKSGHCVSHGPFMLCAIFFGQSAVMSSSQSTTAARHD